MLTCIKYLLATFSRENCFVTVVKFKIKNIQQIYEFYSGSTINAEQLFLLNAGNTLHHQK